MGQSEQDSRGNRMNNASICPYIIIFSRSPAFSVIDQTFPNALMSNSFSQYCQRSTVLLLARFVFLLTSSIQIQSAFLTSMTGPRLFLESARNFLQSKYELLNRES